MTNKEREQKKRKARQLWKYSQKLKEGGAAWERVITQLETLKNELLTQ